MNERKQLNHHRLAPSLARSCPAPTSTMIYRDPGRTNTASKMIHASRSHRFASHFLSQEFRSGPQLCLPEACSFAIMRLISHAGSGHRLS